MNEVVYVRIIAFVNIACMVYIYSCGFNVAGVNWLHHRRWRTNWKNFQSQGVSSDCADGSVGLRPGQILMLSKPSAAERWTGIRVAALALFFFFFFLRGKALLFVRGRCARETFLFLKLKGEPQMYWFFLFGRSSASEFVWRNYCCTDERLNTVGQSSFH